MKPDPLDARRSQSLGRLIARVHLAIGRSLSDRSRLDDELSPAQKNALIQLEVAGSRVTTLAKRLAVSKQAASKLVLELEAKGLVKRTPDPTDGRSFVIGFTARGHEIVEATVTRFDAIEADIARAIGRDALARLKRDLKPVAALLDPDGF